MGPEKAVVEEPANTPEQSGSSPASLESPVVSTGPVLDAPFNGALQPVDPKAIDQGSLLEEASSSMASESDLPFSKKRFTRQRIFGLSLLAFGCLAIVLLLVRIETNKSKAQEAAIATPSARFQQQKVQLGALNKQLGDLSEAGNSSVRVNGQLQVTESLVLQPSTQTAPAVTGQMYFDSNTNLLAYYNGHQYVSIQGGGNTYTTNITNNTAGNTTNVTNVTNNTFVTNTSGGGFGGTGTPGTLAMFNSATTLGNSLITQSGTTLNVGSGTGIVNMQGSAGGVNISTATVSSGASGDISILSGDSSVSSSGSVTIDTGAGIINGTVIENYTFETGLEGFNNTPYGGTNAQSTAQAHGGTHSLALTLNTNSWNSVGTPDITIIPGHEYRWTVWVKAATASSELDTSVYLRSLNISKPTQIFNDNSSGWTEITYTFVNPLGNTSVDLGLVYKALVNTNDVHYIDDFTLTDLSTFTGLTANFGATNAQAVNIGNSGQAGDTTITGGTTGIKIKDSVGAVSVSGTDVSIASLDTVSIASGSGDTTITTGDSSSTSGNISIMSGASSTTASGNVTVDTGSNFVTGTVVENSGFEDGIDNIAGWTGGTVTTQNCTVAHTGSCSLAVSGGAFWGTLENSGTGASITAGHHYFISVWVRAATGGTPISGALIWNVGGFNTTVLSFPTVTTTTAGWTQMSATGIAPAGTTQSEFRIGGQGGGNSNGTQYFDDLTITDLSSGSASSELDLGKTNAQIINIGNMNEVGPTTIEGGSGIDLNSGAAAINVNGGSITVAGTGASSFSTNNGSLTLGSGSGTIVTTHTDSTADFQIQNASGASLLNVDSVNSAIALGASPALLGSTNIGANGNSGGQNGIQFSKITTGGATVASAVSVYFRSGDSSPNNKFQVALYSDNAGSPGAKITSTGDNTITSPGWNTVPFSTSLAGSTTYWLGITENGSFNNADNDAFDVGGNAYKFWNPGVVVNGTTVAYGAWPSTFVGAPAANVSNTNTISAYLSTTSSSSYAIVTDNNGHVGIGESSTSSTAQLDVRSPSVFGYAAYLQGETTINARNTQAFNVYDGVGNSIMSLDSLNSRTYINTDANSGLQGSLNVVANGRHENILNLYGEGMTELSISDSGQANFKNGIDSTAAFQIQNSGGVALMNADTTNSRVSIGSLGTPTGQLYVSGGVPTAALSTTSLVGTAEGLYVQGKYAYVVDSASGKLQIFDASDPANPTSVGLLSLGAGTQPWGLMVVGSYAYITNYNANQLQIVDVSNPAVPVSVGTTSTGTGPRSVAVEGRYAYVVNDNGGSGGGSVQVFDVSNPAHPTQVGSNFTSSVSSPKADYVQGRYLYIANASSATVQAIDISNPASLSSVGTLNGSMSAPHDLTIAGRYAYVVDWSGNKLDIFDESNPSSPALTGSVSTGAGSNPQGVYVQGRYAYVVNGTTNNMLVFDVSNPASPTLVGMIATSTDPIDVMVVGRYAYVLGESSDAMQIFDMGGAYAQQFQAGGTETGTLEVDNNATIQNNLDVRGGLEASGGANIQGSFTVNGTATFVSGTNSTAAVQIQNSSGTALFTADTSGMTITIAGTDSSFGTLTLSNAHFSSSQTTPPNISTPNNCGTTPTATMGAGSTDSAGSFTITTGTGGTSTTCDIQMTFHNAYGSTPKSIIVVPNGSAAAAARQVYVSSQSNVSFFTSFGVSAAGANSTSYTFDYWVVQ